MTQQPPALQPLARYPRPTALGFEADVHSFIHEGAILFAVAKGDLARDGLLVRVQSPCLFGESFGVNSCDCGEQLSDALTMAAEQEAFLLVYLSNQEGRGHGLQTKILAIKEEIEKQVDMPQAFRNLELTLDLRSYGAAAAIINELVGGHSIRLLTNNPKKVEALRSYGIEVERVAHMVANPTDECRRYLRSKRDEMGHLLPDDL